MQNQITAQLDEKYDFYPRYGKRLLMPKSILDFLLTSVFQALSSEALLQVNVIWIYNKYGTYCSSSI